MKVKDLIRDTVWMPGTDYRPDAKPSVSVLLPTFRRGASGSFRKAGRSVRPSISLRFHPANGPAVQKFRVRTVLSMLVVSRATADS